MRRNPRVTLLCYDPRQPLRYLEVRGTVVDMTEEAPAAHLDDLASQVRRPADPLLRRRHPGPLRRDRDPGPVPDPPDPRRRARRHRDRSRAMTTAVAPDDAPIPDSHLDLLTRPICGVLTTMGADGQPQSSLVWVDHDGECARVNTTLERQKGRNLLANPKVSLLVVDPDEHRPLHPDPRRRRARHGRRRSTTSTRSPGATPAIRATTATSTRSSNAARDAGHLPDPRPTDHPRRDPRVNRCGAHMPIRHHHRRGAVSGPATCAAQGVMGGAGARCVHAAAAVRGVDLGAGHAALRVVAPEPHGGPPPRAAPASGRVRVRRGRITSSSTAGTSTRSTGSASARRSGTCLRWPGTSFGSPAASPR